MLLKKANDIYEKKVDDDQYLYVCSGYPLCDSYVTANQHMQPRGTLANPELRMLRREAHRIFDLIWKNKLMSQAHAYFWLQSVMQLSTYECHMGKMNDRQCREVIRQSKKMLENRGITVWDWRPYDERETC